MIWLVDQIFLSLLLAGLAGWYIGWALRGFRDGEQVGDLQRTLRATEDVKDREIAEAIRRAEKLADRNERLARDNERLAERTEERRDWSTGFGTPPGANVDDGRWEAAPHTASVATLEAEPSEVRAGAPEDGAPDDAATVDATPTELELEGRLAEAQARQQDQDRALRDKTAAVLALQAELAKLREAAERRAREMAQLERRVVELEPIEERAADEAGALREARAAVDAAEGERDRALGRAGELEREIDRLREEVDGRDVRINELRNRYHSASAELENLRTQLPAATPKPKPDLTPQLVTIPGVELAETQRLLQRQIERNRKQGAVHRHVVSSLQQRVADLEAQLRARRQAPPVQGGDSDTARWQQLLAERDSRIIGLRRRLVALEQAGESARSDDLRQIHGIGPKIADRLREMGVRTYAQIATWGDEEIERYSRELGDRSERIRRDGWVDSARELERIEIERSES